MKFKYIALSLVVAMAATSCSDDFLTNEPQGSLTEANMQDPEALDLLINGAYATFGCRYADSNDPHLFPLTNWSTGEVRSDNAYKGGGGVGDISEMHDMETMKVQSNNGNCDGKWFNVYCGISRCNAALRALANMPDTYAEKDSRIAEMHVIRSHWYFELVRLFNKVPYMDENLPETEYMNVPNDEFTRDQHLARIAAELMDAAGNLPEHQAEVGRINRNMALAYAAKVKLYQAYEQDEQTHAVININKPLLQEVVEIIDRINGYQLLDDFQKLDQLAYENGSESVFPIQFSMNDGSESAGRINWSMLLNSPSGTGSPYSGDGFFLPSQDLINAYQTDANGLPVFDYQSRPDYATVVVDNNGYHLDNTTPTVDPRLDFVTGRPGITWKTYKDAPCGLWVRDPGTYGYNCIKRFWVSPESGDMYPGWPWGASALNWQLIRYADLLLYKAEALIEIGDGNSLEQARQLINLVRGRAMNSPYVKDFNDALKDAANYKIGLYPATGWNQDYARQALRTEMRLEKAFEGERYFDLVRWGIAKDVMNKFFAAEKDNRIYYDGAVFDNGEEYLPIPVAQYNFSLGRYTQNPGYPAF